MVVALPKAAGWRAAAAIFVMLSVAACSPTGLGRPSAIVERQPLPCPTTSPASSARQAASQARQDSPSPPPTASPPFVLPSFKGLNYGTPRAIDGTFLGTRWLRFPTWLSARQSLAADLDFIDANDLGHVVRIFIGLDQLMVWDPVQGFVRFDPAALAAFAEALTMFDAHGMKVIAVLFDQEQVSSPGNFHFQALDGLHPAMRANYLHAVDQFMTLFGANPVVAGWDLFNEAYGSLGQAGLPTPPAPDPVSPNYPDSVVHAWIHDLYLHAKCAAPNAWFTVSDTTELYWHRAADVSRYDDSVDFYDVHVYDDHPVEVAWKGVLQKPLIMGEVGASVDDHHYEDQRLDSRAVSFWLCTARAEGVKAVLAHNDDGIVFPTNRTGLTPTGYVLSAAQS